VTIDGLYSLSGTFRLLSFKFKLRPMVDCTNVNHNEAIGTG